MTKRYLGNIITQNPTAPTDNFEDTPAPGVWSLAEAFTYAKAGLWPTAGNQNLIGLFAGGNASAGAVNTIEFLTLSTTGNTSDYGDLLATNTEGSSVGSTSRGIVMGGDTGSYTNVIQYKEFSSSGNMSDFGDLTSERLRASGASSATRGLLFNGQSNSSSRTNEIQYITMATTGNTSDFGDTVRETSQNSACASPTRGINMGGYVSASDGDPSTKIEYVTIASTGNGTNFGDLTQENLRLGAAASSDTRGLRLMGYRQTPSSAGSTNTIEYITIASTGDSTDFGDFVASVRQNTALSSNTYAVCAANAFLRQEIDFVTIATTGNSTQWGDLLQSNRAMVQGMSNCHGGLQ